MTVAWFSPARCWFVTALVSWVPRLCEVLDLIISTFMVCSADMTTPLSDEKTETRNTNDYAERVLRFKARGILTARLPSCLSPALFSVWVLFPRRNWLRSLVPPAFAPNATFLKTPKWTNDIHGSPIRWSQTQWLSHCAPNVRRPLNCLWLSFPGQPLCWECPSSP